MRDSGGSCNMRCNWVQNGNMVFENRTAYRQHIFSVLVTELDSCGERFVKELWNLCSSRLCRGDVSDDSFGPEYLVSLWNEFTTLHVLTSSFQKSFADDCVKSRKAVPKRVDERSLGTITKSPHIRKHKQSIVRVTILPLGCRAQILSLPLSCSTEEA